MTNTTTEPLQKAEPSGSIRLHETKGVNPHICICPRCGQENGEIALLGNQDTLWECRCGAIWLQHGRPRDPCPCGAMPQSFVKKELPEYALIPTVLCDLCVEQNKWVEAGGVFWKCVDCHNIGAIRAGHPLSKRIREESGIAAPDQVGIEFNKDTCPVCTGAVKTELSDKGVTH